MLKYLGRRVHILCNFLLKGIAEIREYVLCVCERENVERNKANMSRC